MKTTVRRHKVIQPANKSYRFIPLTRGQNSIVDASDFEWLSQWNWYAEWSPKTKSFYAARRDENNSYVCMHRFILGLTSKKQGDHENHNTLDNRRNNLRSCTIQQNRFNQKIRVNNTSGFKGVSWCEKLKKWWSYIRVNGRTLHLGYFLLIKDAARAYDKAAKRYFGVFANPNFQ